MRRVLIVVSAVLAVLAFPSSGIAKKTPCPWDTSGPGITGQLTNGDDRQYLHLNHQLVAFAGYQETVRFTLPRLKRGDELLFEAYNDVSGTTWGLQICKGSRLVVNDVEGVAGSIGAFGNRQDLLGRIHAVTYRRFKQTSEYNAG